MDDIVGKKFNKLVVLEKTTYRIRDKLQYLCLCDCGKETYCTKTQLKHNRKKSCGCLRSLGNVKHGNCYHPLYSTWSSMKNRCYNTNEKRYSDYGGRGIVVCDRWKESFNNFLEDMGEKPTPQHSLDRIDADGNYEPKNCRWADDFIQTQNTRKSSNNKLKTKHIILYYDDVYLCRIIRNGKERKYLTKSLEDAIKVRDCWLKEFNENSLLWVENTKNNKYKTEINDILNIY